MPILRSPLPGLPKDVNSIEATVDHLKTPKSPKSTPLKTTFEATGPKVREMSVSKKPRATLHDTDFRQNSRIQEAVNKAASTDQVANELLQDSDNLALIETELRGIGLTSWKSNWQAAACISLVRARSTFVHLPTGSGKSLVWLLAALALAKMGRVGVTIVVFPLIALLRDQFHRITKFKFDDEHAAVAIDHDTPPSARRSLYERLRKKDPSLRFLFLSPAMLVGNPDLFTALAESSILLFVFDEYHTLLDWASFYTPMSQIKKITDLLSSSNQTPIAFLSATGTTDHVKKLSCDLTVESYEIVSSPLVRPNICLDVNFLANPVRASAVRKIATWIKLKRSTKTPVIIFCPFVKECERMAESLVNHGFVSGYYHGNMSSDQRSFVLACFHANYFDVLAVTDAFGLGMDSTCLHVIEWGIAFNLRSHIQRTGRSGRNLESISRTLVLVSVPLVIDAYRLFISDPRALMIYNEAILHFFETNACRHVALNLWPSALCGSATCNSRCDTCEFHFNIQTIDILTCARTLVGSGLPDDRGIIGELEKQQRSLILSNIINEWEAQVHLKCDSGDDIKMDLRQFIILRLCAMEFFEPALVGLGSKSRVQLCASSPRLLRCLYDIYADKPEVSFKVPC